jgi:hypothetical protein
VTIREALERLAVLDTRGPDFHYTNCGIYNRGLFTTRKPKDDPTYACTCGRDEALRIVAASAVGHLIAATVTATQRRGVLR